MTMPSHRIARNESFAGDLAPSRDRIEGAVAALHLALREVLPAWRRSTAGRSLEHPSLVPGGLILLTDDGRGISRAVAADLKALGHQVLRVRHGVGASDVEGVNLTASTAVAALIDRARSRGPVSGIIHLAPMRGGNGPDRAQSGNLLDDARSLALLAQAAADDLMVSANRGGSCLVVAHIAEGDEEPGDTARLARWVEISANTLVGVRVRDLTLDPREEVEVLAADIVREVLGTADSQGEGDPPLQPFALARPESEAVLIGAPDRATWIHLAAALIDWLEDAPAVRLIDLAYTLHHEQPEFPFRVGLVATSSTDLVERLQGVIASLADPFRLAINDPSGAYWDGSAGGTEMSQRLPTSRSQAWASRPRRKSKKVARSSMNEGLGLAAIPAWSGRDWLNHLVASRFAMGDRVRAELLLAGRRARLLDLASPPTNPGGSTSADTRLSPGPGWDLGRLLYSSMNVLDEVLDLRRQMLMALFAEIEAPARPAV